MLMTRIVQYSVGVPSLYDSGWVLNFSKVRIGSSRRRLRSPETRLSWRVVAVGLYKRSVLGF